MSKHKQILSQIEHKFSIILKDYGETISFAAGNRINALRSFVEDKIKEQLDDQSS